MMAKGGRKPDGLTSEARMPFVKRNYLYMLIGGLVVVLGFLLMLGGNSTDPAVFNEEVFGFREITLAPLVVMLGFFFVIYAILYRPKHRDSAQEK